MARPKSDNPRTETMGFRATPGEKARIQERAIASGMKLPDFLRARALGLKPRGLQRPEPAARRAPEQPVNPVVTPTDVEVGAEIAEAAMSDEDAQAAFIKRRTTQLIGQGCTSLVARNKAGIEWRTRGTKSA
jgi:hypothetical protein